MSCSQAEIDLRRKFGVMSPGVLDVLVREFAPEDGSEPEPDSEFGKMANAGVLADGQLALFTGQFASYPLKSVLAVMQAIGYTGMEVPCWGHFDPEQAASDEGGEDYCGAFLELLGEYGIRPTALSTHLVGQALCDPASEKLKAIVPPHIWSDDTDVRVQNVQGYLVKVGIAAARLGLEVVNLFSGSDNWGEIYDFPPAPEKVARGYRQFADRMVPVLDRYGELGVFGAMEVHPTEIAYDFNSLDAVLDALNGHKRFGVKFDPSHLVPQDLDEVEFILQYAERILDVHAKESKVRRRGRQGIYVGHLDPSDPRRRFIFASPGWGDVDWIGVREALLWIKYRGAIAVEWEHNSMSPWFGIYDAFNFLRRVLLAPTSAGRFDKAFQQA